MRLGEVPVIALEEVAWRTFELRLRAPWLADSARPGQFVYVSCGDGWDPLLRRPFSLHRLRRTGAASPVRLGEGEAAVLFRLVGRGTDWLSERKTGDLVSVLGPLGHGFSLAATTRNLLLVAGGLGVAPLVMLADEAVKRGLAVTLAAGYRTGLEVYPAELLPEEVEYLVATEDGTRGRRGLVTELLAEPWQWADQVCACGPNPMLAALRGLPGNPVQVSLEEHMGCGLGVCYGCVVETRHGLRRVCHDGPVFDLDEVVW